MAFNQRFTYIGSSDGLSPFIRIRDKDGNDLVSRTQTGVSESPAGTNNYVYDASLSNSVRGQLVEAIWDEGTQNESSAETLIAVGDDAKYPIDSQKARDALKLAPTSGNPAAGSIDAELDTLLQRTAAGVTVAAGGSIAEDQKTLVLVQGEAYLRSIDNAITLTITDERVTSSIETDGTIPILRLQPRDQQAGKTLKLSGQIDSFDASSSTAELSFELTQSASADLRPGPAANRWELDWQIGGDDAQVITSVIDSPCTVRPHIA